MKYYKGTRRRKSSKESSQTSPENRSENQRGKKRAISNPESEETKISKKSKQQKSSDSKNELHSSNDKKDNATQLLQSREENEPKTRSKPTTKKTSSTTSQRKPSTQSRNISTETTTEKSTKRRVNSKQKSGSESDSEPQKVCRTSHAKVKTKDTKSSNQRTTSREEQNTSSSEISDSPFEHDQQQPISGVQVSYGSMEETVPSSDEFEGPHGRQSDREFLQQQVQLLMSPFEVSDCFELASRGKRRNKDHIPPDIITKSLRKLNYKIEDDLLKTLNRQAQRRITNHIQEISLHSQKALESTRQLDDGSSQPGNENDLESLKEMLESSEQEQNELEVIKKRAHTIESLVEELDGDSLSKEISQTNKLLKKIHDKVKKQGFPDFDSTPVTYTTTKGPFSHQDIVNQLFPK